MKWIETKVIFEFAEKEFAAELISNIFYDMGLKGVVAESTEADLSEGWADDAGELPENDAVIAYFPKNDLIGNRCEIMEKELIRLEKENGITTTIVYNEIDEEDWQESWKAYFFPEKISNTIVVKPTWREYQPAKHEIVFEIDPGMAFGTGTHPTTALCVRMIEAYLKSGDSVLDIGTGSGILMIAAAKLGAQSVWGVDTDEVAVEIAEKNLLLNRIEKEKFNVMAGNLTDKIGKEKFDIVIANILSEVILVLLDNVKTVLKKGGIFISSGIIEENKDAVVQKMKNMGFDILDIRIEEKWVAIVGRI